jgi:hypothetical protein
MTNAQNQKLEANFITLAMSVASSAAISMGLAPDPQNGKVSKNLDMARFNIDLLEMLSEKTRNNLIAEEAQFMEHVIADLKLKFVEINSREVKK